MAFTAFAAAAAALLDSETARDFDLDERDELDSLIRLCTGFVVIQIFNANFSSALKASQGVIWNEKKTSGIDLRPNDLVV